MEKSGQADERKKTSRSYLKLLTIVAIVILAAITLRSAISVVLFIAMTIREGTFWTGDFWSNEFPTIVLLVIAGLGSFGIYKLIRILRR